MYQITTAFLSPFRSITGKCAHRVLAGLAQVCLSWKILPPSRELEICSLLPRVAGASTRRSGAAVVEGSGLGGHCGQENHGVNISL